jgi:hypothetical protein
MDANMSMIQETDKAIEAILSVAGDKKISETHANILIQAIADIKNIILTENYTNIGEKTENFVDQYVGFIKEITDQIVEKDLYFALFIQGNSETPDTIFTSNMPNERLLSSVATFLKKYPDFMEFIKDKA